MKPRSWRANPDEETTDWRAVRGRTAHTVRRAGRALALPDPYRFQGDDLTWVSVSVSEEKARELAGLAKGAEVYVEGRLSLNAWTGRDGTQRTGLSVTAWQAMPLGQIGRRKPKVQSRDEYERPRDEQDAVPFDDPLRF